MKIPKLQISAKAKSWRIHDDIEKQIFDTDNYQQIRSQILRRDKFTCQFCGFNSASDSESPKKSLAYSGFLEVHHIDDDHSNNVPENLITACPFCHSVFHAGFSGHNDAGSIALMPYMRQRDISILFNLLAVIKSSDESKYLDLVEDIEEFFEYFIGSAENVFEGLSDASKLGSILVGVQIKDKNASKKMNNVLWALKLIPNINSNAFKDAVAFWRTNGVWIPEAQWKSIFDNFSKINQKIKK